MATLPRHIIPGNSSDSAISVAQSPSGTLCIAWKGNNNNFINLAFNNNQGVPNWQWSGHTRIPNQSTRIAPSITYFGERLFIAWISDDGSNKMYYTFSDDNGQTFGYVTELDNALSNEAPSLYGGSSLFIAFKGLDGSLNVMKVG